MEYGVDLLFAIGIVGALLGLLTASAGVAVAAARSRGPERLIGGGIALEGLAIAATSAGVLLASRLGGTLPIAAGLLAIAIVAVTAVRLQRAASRAFRHYVAAKAGDEPRAG